MNKRPDLNLLVIFDAVATEQSVTRAAERLSLSQSAVSHALNRMRDKLGDPLFVRGTDGLRATPRALEMIEPIKNILRSADAIFATGSFNPALDRRRFRMAATDYAISIIVQPLFPAFLEQAPNAVLEVLPGCHSTLADLEAGTLDCCFWAGPLPSYPWIGKLLLSEKLVGVISENHPLAVKARKERVSVNDYLAYPHVITGMKEVFRSHIDIALDAIGRTRVVRASTHSYVANIASLLTSDLITTLPARLAEKLACDRLVVFELPLEATEFTYSLIWHERTHRDHAMVWFRELIAEVAREKYGETPDAAVKNTSRP